MTDQPTITIRMRRCPDRTLWDYVFTDEDHARKWLRSYNVIAADVELERVTVGPLRLCSCCNGKGFRQTIQKLENVSLAEVLNVE